MQNDCLNVVCRMQEGGANAAVTSGTWEGLSESAAPPQCDDAMKPCLGWRHEEPHQRFLVSEHSKWPALCSVHLPHVLARPQRWHVPMRCCTAEGGLFTSLPQYYSATVLTLHFAASTKVTTTLCSAPGPRPANKNRAISPDLCAAHQLLFDHPPHSLHFLSLHHDGGTFFAPPPPP
jgi:hypothetical protein